MSAQEPAPVPPSKRAPLRGLLVAGFVFFAGPPIGALLLIGPGYLLAVVPSTPPVMSEFLPPAQNELTSYLSVAVFFVLFSHLFGGAQALFTGLWLGARTYWRGGFGYTEAALAALVVSVVWGLRAYGGLNEAVDWSRTASDLSPGGGLVLSLGAISVVSALICRWLLRRVRILPGESRSAGPADGKS